MQKRTKIVKIILQIFIFFSMCFSTMLEADFIDVKVIKLKKDEQKKILVKYDSKEKLFQFRWTLYKNDGLVVFRSYDKIVAQNILYIRNKNQSFRFYLKPKGGKSYDVPYVLVKFKAFDYQTNEATFELFLSDKNMQISLKYL